MITIAISCAAGAAACSIAEHFLGMNFADRVLNVFRSAEQELKAAESAMKREQARLGALIRSMAAEISKKL